MKEQKRYSNGDITLSTFEQGTYYDWNVKSGMKDVMPRIEPGCREESRLLATKA